MLPFGLIDHPELLWARVKGKLGWLMATGLRDRPARGSFSSSRDQSDPGVLRPSCPLGTATSSVILDFDVPSYHTDAAQQRGQEQKVNPRVRSIGIRPPPILRRPAVLDGPRASLRPAAGFIRPTACSLPDSFFPGRERVINAASGIIHGGRWRWAR